MRDVRHLLRWCLVLCCLSGTALADTPGGWQLAKQGDGVSVWKRPARTEAGVVEFKAETQVDSSLSALLALIYDVDGAPQWIDHCRRVKVLRRDDANREYALLIETWMPWPVKDRDAVVSGRWWQDPNSRVVFMRARSVDGILAVNPDYIRQRIRVDWTLEPRSDGLVTVRMEGEALPGGLLPLWAVNLLIQESPWRTLRNLRKVIVQGKYQEQVIPGIVEPGK